MTSTSTYAFDPTTGDIVLHALSKCKVFPTDVTLEHLRAAQFEANLLNVDITNRNPNMFCLETATQVLSTTAAYTLNARVVSIACAYVTNDSNDTCRVIGALSATQYAQINDKTTTASGGPTSYFFSALKTPTITVWPLVSATDTVTYTLNMLTFRQLQDFDNRSSYTADLPYRFLDAFTYGLAARLADTYRPEMAQKYEEQFERKFALCAAQDQEDVPITMVPDLSGYAP